MNDPNAAPLSRGRAQLSALMDGDGEAADEACRAWRNDASARADWHAYHVIGDVLRSEDAAGGVGRDARFLARFRERLADEPVLLAPARERRPWITTAAVAAGFVAVAGVLVVTRMAGLDESRGAAPALAMNKEINGPVAVVANLQSPPGAERAAASAPVIVAGRDGRTLIRNPELDRYLAAHRQYANASPLTAPGGVLRSATVVSDPGR
ncbi:MAG: sigma-E factor negative regulatory protein [Aquincola sp.]|nr:sigma-E factor negative regulatory protein [Aquincola sp.]MDH5329902.1 sigma-E factor negative regulatory protein [Aquincola sp.]